MRGQNQNRRMFKIYVRDIIELILNIVSLPDWKTRANLCGDIKRFGINELKKRRVGTKIEWLVYIGLLMGEIPKFSDKKRTLEYMKEYIEKNKNKFKTIDEIIEYYRKKVCEPAEKTKYTEVSEEEFLKDLES